MNFKEFLKKNGSVRGMDRRYDLELLRELGILRIKDLGEWAWKRSKGRCKFLLQYTEPKKIILYHSKDELLEQAVACLGEKEVEKRLKHLKSDDFKAHHLDGEVLKDA